MWLPTRRFCVSAQVQLENNPKYLLSMSRCLKNDKQNQNYSAKNIRKNWLNTKFCLSQQSRLCIPVKKKVIDRYTFLPAPSTLKGATLHRTQHHQIAKFINSIRDSCRKNIAVLRDNFHKIWHIQKTFIKPLLKFAFLNTNKSISDRS